MVVMPIETSKEIEIIESYIVIQTTRDGRSHWSKVGYGLCVMRTQTVYKRGVS